MLRIDIWVGIGLIFVLYSRESKKKVSLFAFFTICGNQTQELRKEEKKSSFLLFTKDNDALLVLAIHCFGYEIALTEMIRW